MSIVAVQEIEAQLPQYYDWSVGVKDSSPGSGLLDVNNQPVWHEAGTQTEAVFSLADSKLTGIVIQHLIDFQLDFLPGSLKCLGFHMFSLYCFPIWYGRAIWYEQEISFAVLTILVLYHWYSFTCKV